MEEIKIDKDRLRRLLVAKRLDIASDEELRELDTLLARDAEMQKVDEALSGDRHVSKRYYSRLWRQGELSRKSISLSSRSRHRSWGIAAAAVAVVLFGLTLRLNNVREVAAPGTVVALNATPEQGAVSFPEEIKPVLQTLDLSKKDALHLLSAQNADTLYPTSDPAPVSNGKESTLRSGASDFLVILEDGTRVHLGYASKLVFPNRFRGDKREVTLSGEAYVEVAKSKKPFYIHTANGTIRQYGTSFHVSAKPGASSTEVVLVEGSVGIYPGNAEIEGEPLLMLAPGQKAVIDKEIHVEAVDTLPYRAWNEGAIEFEDIPLNRLLSVVSMWYGVKIADPSGIADSAPLTGSLRRTSPLEDILSALSETTGISLKLIGDTVAVSPDR